MTKVSAIARTAGIIMICAVFASGVSMSLAADAGMQPTGPFHLTDQILGLLLR